MTGPGGGVHERWMRAVELGGEGYAARAITLLDEVRRETSSTGDVATASLCRSTHGSLLRQSGQHTAALVRDGAAVAVLAPVMTDDAQRARAIAAERSCARAAAVDALVGLAADNLGRGQFGATRRLLVGAEPWLPTDGLTTADWITDARIRLRWEWVSAEYHLYSGRPEDARSHSAAATALVDEAPETTARHRIKTDLIAAATSAASGEREIAADLATRCRVRAAEHRLLPLEWAALSLLSGVAPGPEVTRDLASSRAELIARGMPFD